MRVWPTPALSAVTALAVALPANAQSPGPTVPPTSAFDGVYVGVSAENNSTGNTLAGGRGRTQGYAGARACRDFRAPARLTITNGHAQVRWGNRTLDGSAAPDGSLSMMTGYGQKFEGRIDGQQIKGQLVGYCAYNLTWRKRGSSPGLGQLSQPTATPTSSTAPINAR